MVFINVLYLPVISLLSSNPTISTLSLPFSDFVDILNVLLHLSNYKLECPGKNTPGTKTHIVNTSV